MVIDFIGSPGAGKSTFVPIAIDSLRQAGIEAHRVGDAAKVSVKDSILGQVIGRLAPARYQDAALWHVFYRLSLFYRIKFALKHFRLHQYVLSSQRRRPLEAEAGKRRIIPGFLTLMGAYEFLLSKGKANQAVLFDEGFVHRVIQLTTSDQEIADPEVIETYLNLLPPPDLTIYIDTPVGICLDRVISRGIWGHYRHKSPDQIASFITNAHAGVEMAVQSIRERGWPLVEINNGAPLQWTESALREKIFEAVTRVQNSQNGLQMSAQHQG